MPPASSFMNPTGSESLVDSQPSFACTETGAQDKVSLCSIPEPVYSGELPYSLIPLTVSEYMAVERSRLSLEPTGKQQVEWFAPTNDQFAFSGCSASELPGTSPGLASTLVTSTSCPTQRSTSSLLDHLQKMAKKTSSQYLKIEEFKKLMEHLRTAMMRELRNYKDHTLELNGKRMLWDDQDWKAMAPPFNNATRQSIIYAYRTMARTILVLIEKYRRDAEEIECYKRSYSSKVPEEIMFIESTWCEDHDPLVNLWYRLQRYWELFSEKGEQGRVAQWQYNRERRATVNGVAGPSDQNSQINGSSSLGADVFPQELRNTLSSILVTKLRGNDKDYSKATTFNRPVTANLDMDLLVQQVGISSVHHSSLQEVVLPLIQSRASRNYDDALDALLGFFWQLLNEMIPSEIAKPDAVEYEESLFIHWIGLGKEWLEAGTPVPSDGQATEKIPIRESSEVTSPETKAERDDDSCSA